MQLGLSRVSVLRSAVVGFSWLGFAAVVGIGLVASQGDTALASSKLPYHQGYYTTQGWMCYGWPNRTWHCTQQWYRASDGTLISQNPAWVPNLVSRSAWRDGIPASQRDPVPHYDAHRKPVVAPIAHAFIMPAQAFPAPQQAARPAPPAQPAPSVGQQAVINEINAVFGGYAASALAIARCESGYNPYAVNPIVVLGSHAQGVFQILYPSTWNTTSYAGQSPFNYVANIQAAYQIFARDGYTWREWQCQP